MTSNTTISKVGKQPFAGAADTAATMAKTNLFTASLLPLLLIACGGFSEDTDPGTIANQPSRPGTEPGAGPKAPPVEGKPQSSDLVEALGVFVTNAGSATPDGTRARPFASIQQGIDAAKKVGKRVYVCAGSFDESIVLADSISVIGGLDCSKPEWTVGAPDARSKIVAPTSPALTARSIATATKLSGLDVVAPNATEPGASSIGLLAEKSPGLVVASSSISAGEGAKGADGAEGIQLVQAGTLDGAPSEPWAICTGATCKILGVNTWGKVMGNPPATSVCVGEAGHDGEVGGTGGSGGLFTIVRDEGGYAYGVPYGGAANSADGGGSRTSAVGLAGFDAVNNTLVGSLGPSGYVTANGNKGTNGSPGKGGSGGSGHFPSGVAWSASIDGQVARGASGASGGAGGCPGLAGEPGQGGGASIALALVESPLTLEDTKLTSATGGAPGLGAFGSKPSRGGAAAYGPGIAASQHGGNGGVAGTSSNGTAGPSFAIAHVGGAPSLDSASKTEPGKGGTGVPARTKTENGVGTLTSIAATPDGLSEAIHAF